ncbi:MAG: ATP-binding protein, partial [Planctomycetota bacterium]|nr:ATP-binding protein [Planctomycetota bacterium]
MARGTEAHQFERTRPSGIVLEIRGSPRPGGGFVTTYADVTARKHAEEKLAFMNERLQAHAEELKRSNAELEQFAYVASHDLQEPLRMVASYCQLLQRRYADRLDQDANEFIEFAVDGAHRMQQLINDLLAYSRVGSGAIEHQPTDCGDAFDEACQNLETAIKETGAEIQCRDLPVALADRTQLVQLFQNLIGNAIKFRRDQPPRVEVSAKHENGHIQVSVTDNGLGIEAQYADRVFMIFQRLHAATEYPGTGIGLAVCKKIVERHGGQIWFESTPGEGTSFHFTLTPAQEGGTQ